MRELSEKAGARAFEIGLNKWVSDPSPGKDNFLDLSKIASEVEHQPLSWQIAADHGVYVSVRRDDLIHPLLSGNKLYKLYGHIRHWLQMAPGTTLCSFGGAYSNHLHALAAFGHITSRETVGVIRGERPNVLSKTLSELQKMGMRLHFISRERYRNRSERKFWSALEKDLDLEGLSYWVPEGGGGPEGIEGCVTLGKDLSQRKFDLLIQACGTGTTLAGILNGLDLTAERRRKVLGISALRNSFELVRSLTRDTGLKPNFHTDWAISNQHHCGGFAKVSPELVSFINDFEKETLLPIEKVYTAKILLAVSKMIVTKQILPETHVLVMHSGGLQSRHE